MIGEGRFGERLDVLHYFAQNPKASPFTRRDAFVGLRKLAARDKEKYRCDVKWTSGSLF